MRVLHINNEKTWRGGERQTLLTALELRRQGVDGCIACRSRSPLSEAAVRERMPICPLPANGPAALAKLMQVAGQFDLLHCHTGRAHSLAALATVFGRKPLVVSRRVDFAPRRSWFNRWKYRRADKVVCVSQWISRVMQSWGLPARQTLVIYEAVPEDLYLPRDVGRQELAARTGMPLGRKIVGNIAALAGHKDHATLLRAAKVVAESRRDVAFVVIGDGDLKDSLLQLRGELGLTGIVYFTGFIPEAQRFLLAFDVFAMSSCMEGLGTIILDAGMAGVPVATTAGGGLPEAVLQDQTGLLVAARDAPALAAAILRLLEDTALAARLAEAAKVRIRSDFSVPVMARRYATIYAEVLAGAATPEEPPR